MKPVSGGPDMRVSFLVIGAQKAGTSALYGMMARSPDLFLSAQKELHYFDGLLADWPRQDHAPYHACFQNARPGQLCGEVTPIYMFLPECLDRIHAYNPAMRLIVVLRDPVQRAYSHWRMETTRGIETESFGFAIREGRARVAQMPRHYSYVERGFYDQQLHRLYRLFPASQVHVLLHEDLRKAPGDALQGIAGFLGVASAGQALSDREVDYPRSNPALSPLADEDARYLRALYENHIRETAQVIGRDLSAWLA